MSIVLNNENSENIINSLVQEKENLMKMILELENDIVLRNLNFENEIKNLENSITTLKNENNDHLNEIKSEKQKNQNLLISIDEYIEKIRFILNEKEIIELNYKTQIEKLSQEYDLIINEKMKNQNNIENQRKETTNCEEIYKYEEIIKDYERKLNFCNKIQNTLKSELNIVSEENERLKNENNFISSKLTEIRQELKQLKNEHKKLNNAYLDQMNKCDELNIKYQDLKQDSLKQLKKNNYYSNKDNNPISIIDEENLCSLEDIEINKEFLEDNFLTNNENQYYLNQIDSLNKQLILLKDHQNDELIIYKKEIENLENLVFESRLNHADYIYEKENECSIFFNLSKYILNDIFNLNIILKKDIRNEFRELKKDIYFKIYNKLCRKCMP